jgi:hypothetical protein
MNAATVLASLAMLIWLSSVAIVARRERTFSAPLIAATWLTALAPFASFALTGSPSGSSSPFRTPPRSGSHSIDAGVDWRRPLRPQPHRQRRRHSLAPRVMGALRPSGMIHA